MSLNICVFRKKDVAHEEEYGGNMQEEGRKRGTGVDQLNWQRTCFVSFQKLE